MRIEGPEDTIVTCTAPEMLREEKNKKKGGKGNNRRLTGLGLEGRCEERDEARCEGKDEETFRPTEATWDGLAKSKENNRRKIPKTATS
jgi:hypothetical protein